MEYWQRLLSRWGKEYINNKKVIKGGRKPCYGAVIDNELADIARRYNTHDVPIGPSILRCNLLTNLQRERRYDILNRIVDDNADISQPGQ